MLKNFKPAFWVYNFFKKSELAHNVPLYKKYGIKKKYFDSVSADDFKDCDPEPNKYDVLNSFDHILEEKYIQEIRPSYRNELRNWSENGYLILEKFFSEENINAVNNEIDSLLKSKVIRSKNNRRIMFAFHHSDVLKQVGLNEELMRILELLLNKEVMLFQSINFIKGSQQSTHSDSIHMTTFPFGNLIAVWIALEDVTEENGPLHYYPGSHKLPYVMNKDFGNEGTKYFLGKKTYYDYGNKIQELIQNNNLQKKVFLAKKGDIFIWHANLLHGGDRMINNELTRKSMVFHYYTKDSICYHEITQRPALFREK